MFSEHIYHGIKDEERAVRSNPHVISPPAYNGPAQVQTDSPPPPYSGPSTLPSNSRIQTINESSNQRPSSYQTDDSHSQGNVVTNNTIETVAQVHGIVVSQRCHNEADGSRSTSDAQNQNTASCQTQPVNTRVCSGTSTSSRLHAFNSNDTICSTLADIA